MWALKLTHVMLATWKSREIFFLIFFNVTKNDVADDTKIKIKNLSFCPFILQICIYNFFNPKKRRKYRFFALCAKN